MNYRNLSRCVIVLVALFVWPFGQALASEEVIPISDKELLALKKTVVLAITCKTNSNGRQIVENVLVGSEDLKGRKLLRKVSSIYDRAYLVLMRDDSLDVVVKRELCKGVEVEYARSCEGPIESDDRILMKFNGNWRIVKLGDLTK